jgi:FixJ family two-component response regulator
VGAASEAERDACLVDGAVAFIEKPARTEALLSSLRELVGSQSR